MPTKNLAPEPSSIRRAVGETLLRLASDNPDLYVVSADLKTSLSLDKFASRFRSRFIECGVAEANAAGVAAGLAKSGKTVFLASFACFSPAINWAVIKQSICYNHLNVKIIGSHAGLLSADLGATHQMLEDVALARVLPEMEVFAPIDALEAQKIITTVVRSPRPAYIRLVRPQTPVVFPTKLSFTIGQSHLLASGPSATIVGFGPVLAWVLQIPHLSSDVINCSSIKPLDTDTILKSVKKTGRLLVIEDHQTVGGLGEAVASVLLTSGIKCQYIHLAVDNRFGQSARDHQELLASYHLDQSAVKDALSRLLKS